MTIEEFCDRYYVDRKGTNSRKWDWLDVKFGQDDLLSLWVADMEFKTPEPVVEALIKRVEHGVYGYSYVPESYYDAFINWQKKHHNYDMKNEWVRFAPGIIPALYWFVSMYTKVKDAVIVMTPVYYPFLNAVLDTNRTLVTCDLKDDMGCFTIDYEGFENKIIANKVKLFILCSPHNPVGRVWSEQELEGLFKICKKHGVLIISDEIHQDFIMPGHKHIPSAIVANGNYADMIITANSASKTFNLASCMHSNIIIESPELRKTFDAFANQYNKAETSLFGLVASEAAYNGGEEWLTNLQKVIRHNYDYMVEELCEFESIYVTPLEGTYLVFIDLRAYVDANDIKDFMQNKCHLACDYGEWFGENWGGFIRINAATHPDFIKTAMARLKKEIYVVRRKK